METSAKDLARKYAEVFWNGGDLAELNKLTTEDFKYHLGLQPPRDRKKMGEFIQATHATFPDRRVEITDLIEEGKMAAFKWQGKGTRQGAFHGIPPTGKEIKLAGINIIAWRGILSPGSGSRWIR